jgi:hypothetical protein
MKSSNSSISGTLSLVRVSARTGMIIIFFISLFRTNSKSALAKDLVEGIEKDLDKLRRQQENI